MSVRMEHPDLPDQPIDVDELAVASHRAAGWESAPADAVVPAKTPADAGSTASEAAPRPARRVQKEADEK